MVYKFRTPSYFSHAVLLSETFMSLITFERNKRGGLSGRVTWESFLEALGERFGWILARVSEPASFRAFIQISEPSASKKLELEPWKIGLPSHFLPKAFLINALLNFVKPLSS